MQIVKSKPKLRQFCCSGQRVKYSTKLPVYSYEKRILEKPFLPLLSYFYPYISNMWDMAMKVILIIPDILVLIREKKIKNAL